VLVGKGGRILGGDVRLGREVDGERGVVSGGG
jgi:hypothetical protein